MRASTIACALAAILPLAGAGDAPEVTNEPSGTQYVATLPNTASTTGSVVIAAGPGGDGASIQVSFAGLPTSGGPFLYHIHEHALDSTGNCSTAGGHLDPYGNGGTGCNASDPASCEVGDLSGKYGSIQGTSFSANYIDEYVSVKPSADDPASVVGLSIVVHFANKTAITCANLTLGGAGTGGNGVDPLPGDVPEPTTPTLGIDPLPTDDPAPTNDPAPADDPAPTDEQESSTIEEPAAGARATIGVAAALVGVVALVL